MTSRLDDHSPRDLEEVLALATVTLPYDPATGLVLRGKWRGRRLVEALSAEAEWLRLVYRHVRVMRVTLRPWWRRWRSTPALVVMPLPRRRERAA